MAKGIKKAQEKPVKGWTLFWDMHSGGGLKEPPYDQIYIEAPMEEAKLIFYNRFGHNPEDMGCGTCGANYSINESDTLEQASGFHRGCRNARFYEGKEISEVDYNNLPNKLKPDAVWRYVEENDGTRSWNPFMSAKKYEKLEHVLVVRAKDIKPEEREGVLPEAYESEPYEW